jgi:two-component system chemotaxis response regulator CheB
MVVLQTPANRYICHIRSSAPVNGFRLSVEVLFDSVRKDSGMVIGIFLTGMGIDGSQAILRMKEQGSHTICQICNTSIVWGMTGTAVELGAADKTLPINRISPHIIKQVQKFKLPNR